MIDVAHRVASYEFAGVELSFAAMSASGGASYNVMLTIGGFCFLALSLGRKTCSTRG